MISNWLQQWGHTAYSLVATAALILQWWRNRRRRPRPPVPGMMRYHGITTWNFEEIENTGFFKHSGSSHMANIIAPWTKSPSPNVNAYVVLWVRTPAGGSPGAPVSQTVPQSARGDANGYQADFNTGNPGVTLQPGDVVTSSIVAEDTVNNLASTPAAELPAGGITVPTPPPPPAPQPPVPGTMTFVP